MEVTLVLLRRRMRHQGKSERVGGVQFIGKSLLRVLLLSVVLVSGCAKHETPAVVVYTALDEMYSRPILEEFERTKGIKVETVFDTEASKTTGLVQRLIAEKQRPRADVFWNNEVVQTIVLRNERVTAPYISPAAETIPPQFKDPQGYWAGFAARGRVIIYNTDLVKDPPTSILDFAKPEWAGKAAIAKPLFGTTATHVAVLFAEWGSDKAKGYILGLRHNNVAVLPGNATVRDMVAQGEYAVGITDTDDANGAVEDGLPAKWLWPDQEEGGIGALLIPNTVALIRGGPNPEGGKALIDYLLSPEVEGKLARMRSMQIPLKPSVTVPEGVPKLSEVKAMRVDFNKAAEKMRIAQVFTQQEFVR